MDLEEFRAFIAVVETGSFLAAATNLNLARATLRRRVDALEARAGVPLLERSARGVVVTEAGSLLASRGRHVLQEASALIASVREIGREPVGVLLRPREVVERVRSVLGDAEQLHEVAAAHEHGGNDGLSHGGAFLGWLVCWFQWPRGAGTPRLIRRPARRAALMAA